MKSLIDPEYERWRRNYPRFPGVAKCVDLLKSHGVRGTWIDIICNELEAHVADHAAELINAARSDENAAVRTILLQVIANARLPQALPLFVQFVDSPDEGERIAAEWGLKLLDTKEARKALWQAGAQAGP